MFSFGLIGWRLVVVIVEGLGFRAKIDVGCVVEVRAVGFLHSTR